MWTVFVNSLHAVKVNFIVCIMLPLRSSSSQMTLRPRGHSYDVPRVVYDLTKRSFILRSLYKQESVLVYFLLLFLWLTVSLLVLKFLFITVMLCVIIAFDSDNKFLSYIRYGVFLRSLHLFALNTTWQLGDEAVKNTLAFFEFDNGMWKWCYDDEDITVSNSRLRV